LKKPVVPKNLSAAGRSWWRRLVAEFDIADPAGLLLLENGMRQFDRAEDARALLNTEGVTMIDRFGQRRPHPAAAIERDARSGLLAALRALNLDVEPLRDRPGRPAGGS
jgi:phage terminase small subunit